jgi:hypothetical protein
MLGNKVAKRLVASQGELSSMELVSYYPNKGCVIYDNTYIITQNVRVLHKVGPVSLSPQTFEGPTSLYTIDGTKLQITKAGLPLVTSS